MFKALFRLFGYEPIQSAASAETPFTKPVFTRNSFNSWLSTQPESRSFRYSDCNRCLLASFFHETSGIEHSVSAETFRPIIKSANYEPLPTFAYEVVRLAHWIAILRSHSAETLIPVSDARLAVELLRERDAIATAGGVFKSVDDLRHEYFMADCEERRMSTRSIISNLSRGQTDNHRGSAGESAASALSDSTKP